MIARRRLLRILAAACLVASCVLLSGRPRNPLADAFIAAVLSRSASLPISCDGARIEKAGLELRFDRIVVGNPPGYGTESLAILDDASLGFERRSFLDRRVVFVGAKRVELNVTVAGDGSNSLESALRTANPASGSGAAVSIEKIDASVLDARSGTRNWIRDARLVYLRPGMGMPREFGGAVEIVSAMLEFTGNVEANGGSGSFDIRFVSQSDDDLELAIAAHGFEVGFVSPAIMPWLGGGSISGACDFEFDLAWSRGHRFAMSGSGDLRQPAMRVPALSPTVAVGESAIRMNGGIEIDLANLRLRADSLRIESETIYAVANGDVSLAEDSSTVAFEGVLALGFDRAAQRYGPVVARVLKTWGLAAIAGDLEVRLGDPSRSAAPESSKVLPLVATSERLVLSRSDGRAIRVGDASFSALLSLSRQRLGATDVRFGTAAWTLDGSIAVDRMFETSRELRVDLRGDLFTHRLVDPIVAYAGSMPLFLNGEGRLELSLHADPTTLDGSLTYESNDTDFRFDDLRPGVSDVWNFRGKPFRVAAEFRAPRSDGFDLASLELDGRVDADRAEIVRDVFTDLDLPFSLRDRRLTLGPFTGAYFGGRATGEIDVEFETDSTATVHARLECAEAELQHFTAYVGALASGVLAGPFAPHRVRGDNRVSGWVEVDGRGDSLTAIVRSLRGNGAIEIGAGAIEGSALLDAWLPPAPGTENARAVESLRSNFFLENGVLASNDVVLQAMGRTLRLAGRTIPPDQLDFAIEPEDWLGSRLFARVRDRLPARAIAIDGPLSAPILSLPDVATWERATDAELDALLADFVRP